MDLLPDRRGKYTFCNSSYYSGDFFKGFFMGKVNLGVRKKHVIMDNGNIIKCMVKVYTIIYNGCKYEGIDIII